MKKICCLLASLFSFAIALSQPANNNCATAQAIGSLPTPAACPSGAGANVAVAGTLNGATAANPYTYYGTGCTGTSTTMASPANDVWYTFVATGYQLNLTISGSVVNPNVALYSGTCAALGGGIGGCAVGTAGGNATLTVFQMVIGTTYYIQVSGNSAGAGGNFSMTLNNSIDCNNCLGATNLTVTPPPTNGTYPPGTTVNFCFKVNSYTQVNTNWLHGVQLTFGSCWDLSTLTTNPPPNCQTFPAGGTWAYFPAGIGVVNGVNWGPGFYFDTTDPGTAPNNNFGDNCTGIISGADWNFCWSVKTAAACNPGCNLSMSINTSGDGESGSWSSNGCNGDPATNFSAIGACCPPTMAASSACAGQATGTATATPVGAAGPYTYTWTPGGQNTQVATGLTPGTYTVSVTDANNCVATNTVTVGTLPTPTVNVNNPTYCAGGSAVLTATGATTYSWTPGGGLSATTGASVTANPTVTTSYTVVGTSAGCSSQDVSVVTVNPLPTVNVNNPTYCAGGSAVLTATGATTYSWTPGGGLSATTGASVTANPTVTTSYTVTGTSAGCSSQDVSVVTVNPLPTVNVNNPTYCVGGSAVLTATGATTYSWTPGGGLSATTGASVTANPTVTTSYTVTGTSAGCSSQDVSVVTVNPLPTVTVNSATICPGASTTLTATGASTYTWSPAGTLSSANGATVTASPTVTTTYTITGTSGAGCIGTGTATVTIGGAIVPIVNSATICAGSSATLNASGGTTYTWTPSATLSSSTGSSVTANPTVTTTYTITAASGACTGTTTAVVTVNPMPTVTVNSPSICIGASATLNATGATTYSWTPAGGLSATTGASVTANPTVTTTYTVVGTSATCTAQAVSVVTVNPLPIINITNGTVCNGGSAPLTASGASTYTWTPPTGLSATTGANVNANPPSTTQYTVTGTDANGCVNSDTTTVTVVNNPTVTVTTATICVGQQTATLTATGAVTYVWSPAIGLSATTGTSVTATPAATTVYTITGTVGTCTAVATTTVTVNPLPPAVAGSNSPVCVNQTLNLTSGGGTIYSWSGPNIFSSAQQNPSIAGVTIAATGVYTVTVTDVNACVNTATVNVLINPLPIVAVTGATVCIGATINLTANGGTGYSWSGPGGYISNAQNPIIPNATLVMAGNYVVVVTDANGCSNGSTAQVTVNLSLVIVAASNSPICQNATLNLTASSGVSWVWSGPLGYVSNQQNPSINNAQPNVSGTYTVVGTDANGCQGTATTNVTVNPLPTITATSATICIGNSATITAGGATTYTWNTGVTGGSLTSSPASTTAYTVVGTDNNGCVNFTTTNILVNPLPIVTVNSGVICIGNNTVLTANGAINYSWNPIVGLSSGVGSPVTANPTTTTSYTVTGTDVNTCTNTAAGVVIVNPLPIINVASAAICNGNSTTLNATGANSYNWTPTSGLSSGSGASVTANPSTTSAYTVTGTDVNGCINATTLTVTVNPLPLVVIGPQNTSGCAPVCVNFTNTATGTGTCVWNFGNGANSASCNPNYCFTVAGNYTTLLTLTDINGCVNTSTASVTVYPVPNADFNATPQPTTILDNNIHFYDASTGAIISTWNWNLGNGTLSTTQNPTCLYGDTGSYVVSLLVISDKGCRDSIIKIIKIDEDFSLYVPNAFSPNFDGTNDVFMAKGEGIKNFKMWIFDRWGMQVFFSDDIYKGWDGRFQSKGTDIVQEDVYVWKIECKNIKGEPKMLKGTVSLLK